MKTQIEKDKLREAKLNYNAAMLEADPLYTKRGKKWDTVIKFN